MNIAGIWIRRPVMTTLVMMGILIFGIVAYRQLAVSDLPTVDYPTINVSASLPGASPETMASAVATPLEKQFSTIAGIDVMTSSSSQGSTNIVLQFTLDRNIDAAAQDVQAAISKTLRQLPQNIIPPSYQKVDPSASAIIYLALTSKTLPLSQLDEYAETYLAQRLSTVSGVAQVQVYGSMKYAVRVQLDPQAMAIRKIGIDEVVNAIDNANVNLPTGVLWGANKAYTVQADGQLQDAKAFRPMIVAYRDGAPVRLQDIGNIVDGVQDSHQASWYNGARAIVLAIQRQPGTNTVQVATGVKQALKQMEEEFPPSVKVSVLHDHSESIAESVKDVKFTLFLTLCLVVLVIFLFLRNVSATVIPSLALPMSLVGTFAVMYLLNYSLDNLSLMALTLSVGFVVDDAIAMLENIVRHREMGKTKLQAAYDGSSEIGFTIISMTISLAAVFIPVLFMQGIIGRLLHEFAVTIGVAILISGFVSLSLTPMLCSRWLKHEDKHGRLFRISEKFFDGMLAFYDWGLRKAIRWKALTITVSLVVVAATAYLFVIIPKGFIPDQDTGQIFGFTEAAQGISFESMMEHQQAVAKILRDDPNIQNVMSSIGGFGPNNTGRVFCRLKPRGERLDANSIIQELRPKLAQIPGISVYLQNPPVIRIGGQLTKSLYQFTLSSTDMNELKQWAPQLESRLRDNSLFQDATTDLQITNPEITVDINRDRALALGVTADAIENTLFSSYSNKQVSTIYTPSNQYFVIMELHPKDQRDPVQLSKLYVRSNPGQLVPLDAVAKLRRTVGPLTVNHTGQLPSVTVSFNLRPGIALGQAVDEINRTIRDMRLPMTIMTSFQGSAQAFETSTKTLWILLIIAVLVIYMVLGILYESFIHPLTILSGLPSAGFGALLTLVLFKVDLSLYAFVGLIMLIGIVKKNAIMMIDFALDAQRNEGKSPAEAIYQGCLVRFRPIMMTTAAALLGSLPIALGWGAGAEARRPLGLAVVGGLLFSQLITLYLTPVVYIYMEAIQRFLTRRKGQKKPRKRTKAEVGAPRRAAPQPVGD